LAGSAFNGDGIDDLVVGAPGSPETGDLFAAALAA
jgi:FG-GAP repeat